jgi:arsenate reductase (glutaredoxin)
MYTLYGIPNCDTVKKARTWLDKNGVEYHFHDYKKEGITAERINEWYKQFPWDKIVNKASTTWKELSDAEKAAITDGKSAVDLIMSKNSVVKRPLIEDASGKAVALGFNEALYKEIFLQ